MNVFRLCEIASWAGSAVLALWLVADLVRTNRRYGEDVLMSSREGDIEDELVIDPTQAPTRGAMR